MDTLLDLSATAVCDHNSDIGIFRASSARFFDSRWPSRHECGDTSLSHRAAALRFVPPQRSSRITCHVWRPHQCVAPRPVPSRAFAPDLIGGLVTALDMAQLVHRNRTNLCRDVRREYEFQFAAQCQCLRRNVTPLDIRFFVRAQFQKMLFEIGDGGHLANLVSKSLFPLIPIKEFHRKGRRSKLRDGSRRAVGLPQLAASFISDVC